MTAFIGPLLHHYQGHDLIGLTTYGYAQNAALYYGAGGGLEVGGVGPVPSGTSTPAGCARTFAYSLQTANSLAAFEATNLSSLETIVFAQLNACASAVSSAVQSFASSCKGQLTIDTQPFGPWTNGASDPEFQYSTSYSTYAICNETAPYAGDVQIMSGGPGGQITGFYCPPAAPYAVITINSNGDVLQGCGTVASKMPSVSIVDASNIKDGVLAVKLNSSTTETGNVSITFLGIKNTPTQTFVNLATGTQSISLNLANIPPDTYGSATATWSPSGVTAISSPFTLSPWVFFGSVYYTQYNTPTESQCSGATAAAWIVTSACTFTPITLNATFVSQALLNGTGNSVKYGILKNAAATALANKKGGACYGKYPSAAVGNTFVQVSTVTGSCNSTLVNNYSAAGPANPTNLAPVPLSGVYALSCGNTLNLDKNNASVYNRTDADLCAACGNAQNNNGANGHVDSYTSVAACNEGAVGSLGTFFSSKTN